MGWKAGSRSWAALQVASSGTNLVSSLIVLRVRGASVRRPLKQRDNETMRHYVPASCGALVFGQCPRTGRAAAAAEANDSLAEFLTRWIQRGAQESLTAASCPHYMPAGRPVKSGRTDVLIRVLLCLRGPRAGRVASKAEVGRPVKAEACCRRGVYGRGPPACDKRAVQGQ